MNNVSKIKNKITKSKYFNKIKQINVKLYDSYLKTFHNIIDKCFKDKTLITDELLIKTLNYTFIFLLVIIISILTILLSNKKEERIKFNDIGVNDFVNDDKYINLDAEIYGEYYNFDLLVPKKEPTDMDIVDRILNVVSANLIKGDNKSLNEVKTNLNLITKNSYEAIMKWESKKGYIDVKTGDVIRPYKGEGTYNDVLSLTVSYKDIKKVKEFKIKILEDELTKEELNINKLVKQIQKLSKNNDLFIKGEKNKLPEELNNTHINWYYPLKNDGNDSYIIVYIFIIIYLLLVFNEFYKVKKVKKDYQFKIENQFIDFVEDYLLLEKASFNLANAIKYINSKYDKDNELKHELVIMDNKISLSENPYTVLESFSSNTNSSAIKRFTTTLIVNLKRGNENLDEILKNELTILNNNKKYAYSKKAEENNIKAILPLMMILISTMLMVVYPAIACMNL